MSTFPWENLKAETLRSVCKDLGVASGVKRNRESMITFVKDLEQGGSATVDGESSSEMLETPDTIQAATILASLQSTGSDADMDSDSVLAGSTAEESVAVPKAASVASPEPQQNLETSNLLSSDNNVNVDSDSDLDAEMLFGASRPTCGCQDGWLSPRLKFILHATAGVAQDLIRGTGELAGEYGHVGGVYLAHHIPRKHLPAGKKAAPLWVDAFAMMFKFITDIFEAGRIPTAGELERTLGDDRKGIKIAKAYMKQGADCEQVLSALVLGAKSDWEEGDFQDAYCGDEKWDALPTCEKHDCNWSLAEDALVG
ncbi:hypothetical protein DFH09DRAFT_1156882 [Mycena vulgaris]|nr:hypothetical protein DFH09DRAFT_1156882 [Mycena vulgaris]